MDQMKVSVVIPVYNQTAYLAQALDSVLGQSRRADEVIVVDDGSIDSTAAVCRQYGSSILYIRQENAGPAAARNSGIARASGELVLFLDGDDVLSPRWIERAVSACDQARARGLRVAAVYGDSIHFDNAGTYRRRVRASRVSPRSLLHQPLHVSGSLTTRQCLDDVGRFNEDLAICEDWDYALRAALQGYSFVRVLSVAYMRRVHAESLTADELALLWGRDKFFRFWLGSERLSSEQKRSVRQELARNSLLMRRAAYYRGEPADDYVAQALRLDPDILMNPWLGVFGAVYTSSRFRSMANPAPTGRSVQMLYADLLRYARIACADRHVFARLQASSKLALAADQVLQHQYINAARTTLTALLADPRLIAEAVRHVARAYATR